MQSVGGCHALLPPLVSASVSDFTNAVGTAFNMVWPAPTDALGKRRDGRHHRHQQASPTLAS